MALNYGWINLNNKAVQIACEKWSIDIDAVNIEIEQLALDNQLTWYLGEIKRVIKLKNVLLNNQADFETLLANIKTYNAAGAWKIHIQTSSTPTWLKIDGTNDNIDVLCRNMRGCTKISPGDQQIYLIKSIEFWQG